MHVDSQREPPTGHALSRSSIDKDHVDLRVLLQSLTLIGASPSWMRPSCVALGGNCEQLCDEGGLSPDVQFYALVIFTQSARTATAA
jgi:hypothetical protein